MDRFLTTELLNDCGDHIKVTLVVGRSKWKTEWRDICNSACRQNLSTN